MEIGAAWLPSSVTSESPLLERRRPELWQAETFYEQLSAPDAFAYERLPHEIHLDEQWHRFIGDLVRRTVRDGKEWSADVACLDREGPLLSQPFDLEPYFQQWWGPRQAPILISHLSQGSESLAKASTLPATINWFGEAVALKRVGFLHTHPSNMAFSDDDFHWLVYRGAYAKQEKFIAAATKTATYFLLRTTATPDDAYQRLQKEHQRHHWLNIQFRPQQAILARNEQLAEAYKLGLYSGMPSAPLTRLA